MLTVGALTDELGLELLTGAESAGRALRWVHISELDDPTPWLSGGELLLTTGIPLATPASQREYVHRLVEHGVAGLGFGTGFDHDSVPKALLKEAGKLDFPLFEVPYRMPFIAITKAVAARLVNEQYEVLQRGIAINKRLERLVLEERGLDEIVSAIATAIQGSVLIFDPRGETMARKDFSRPLSDQVAAAVGEEIAERSAREETVMFSPRRAELADSALAYPIAARGTGIPQAWMVAVPDAGAAGDFERLILQQAVTVVALELMRRRVERETERRLAGNLLTEAFGGRLDHVDLAGRLRPFGIGDRAAVLAFSLADPAAAEETLQRSLLEHAPGAIVATHDSSRGPLLCAILDPGDGDPVEIAAACRRVLASSQGRVRAAASRVAPVGRLRHSFHEARCAMEAVTIANGDDPEVASHVNLGAFTVLLSAQDDEALGMYADSVLAPLEHSDDGYGDELIRSLEAFIEHNGQWERAAKSVYCHRHTLRYRVKRIEELTGRDLSRAQDRIEFWLALRARELVR